MAKDDSSALSDKELNTSSKIQKKKIIFAQERSTVSKRDSSIKSQQTNKSISHRGSGLKSPIQDSPLKFPQQQLNIEIINEDALENLVTTDVALRPQDASHEAND